MNAIIIILIALLDTLLYGYLYEKKGYKWAIGWVVWTSINSGEPRTIVPVYRVVMFLLELAGGLYLASQSDWFTLFGYHFGGSWQLLCYLLCLYFPVKDVIYYSANWQLQYIIGEKGSKDLYWLEHWFQAGYWQHKDGFNLKWFFGTGIGVLVLTILSNLI